MSKVNIEHKTNTYHAGFYEQLGFWQRLRLAFCFICAIPTVAIAKGTFRTWTD